MGRVVNEKPNTLSITNSRGREGGREKAQRKEKNSFVKYNRQIKSKDEKDANMIIVRKQEWLY